MGLLELNPLCSLGNWCYSNYKGQAAILITSSRFSSSGFSHTHDIEMQGDIPTFVKRTRTNAESAVYIWVSPTANPHEFEPLYVGKAGYGVDRRLQQHRGGFVHSGTGRRNCALIIDWLRSGRSIAVFTRIAATTEMFGVHVSLYSSEEEALCEVFEPPWNRASFPGSKKDKAVTQVDQAIPENLPQATETDLMQLAHGDEIATFLDSLSEDNRTLFQHLTGLVEQRFPGQAQKIIKGYTNQPPGYNNKPMLLFSNVGPAGRALPKRWVARIPLLDERQAPLTILFPTSAKRDDLRPELISEGKHGAWRPLDIAVFLNDPDSYLR